LKHPLTASLANRYPFSPFGKPAVSNLRASYRHQFAPDDRLRVDLSGPGGQRLATGQIVNMSPEGIAVDLDGASLRLDPAQPIAAHFAIPHGLRRFALPAAVVHIEATAGGHRLGLRFLTSGDSGARDDRERALMLFLLDEQRRDLWRQRVLAGS
jgi:hypothetical protein